MAKVDQSDERELLAIKDEGGPRLVDAAAARVVPPPEPARLIGVNEGKEGYFEA
jgi:hypothetical protein